MKDIFGKEINRNPLDKGLGTSSKPKSKRTLGIREKQILYERAEKKCEACGKVIDFSEMLSGHKTAASKGGRATLRNSVCLCYKCNKLQGTDSWATFLKKRGKPKTIFSRTNEVRYDNPQVILELINRMCNSGTSLSNQAKSDFIDLYVKKAEKTVSDETERIITDWEKTNSDRLSKGIKIYDENIPYYKVEDSYLYMDKKGITREEYIEKIKENIERAFQYNTQKYDPTRDSETFKLVEPQKYIEDLEKRKYKEKAEIVSQSANRLANALMSGMFIEKEKVAFSLTHKNKDGDYDIIGMDATGQIKLCRKLISNQWEPPTNEKTIFENL